MSKEVYMIAGVNIRELSHKETVVLALSFLDKISNEVIDHRKVISNVRGLVNRWLEGSITTDMFHKTCNDNESMYLTEVMFEYIGYDGIESGYDADNTDRFYHYLYCKHEVLDAIERIENIVSAHRYSEHKWDITHIEDVYYSVQGAIIANNAYIKLSED
jgi:hypothetical protein